jgi:DNA repair protein RadA/Sms
MSKASSVFECQSCGFASPKWLGRCPDCGNWNSFAEEKRSAGSSRGSYAGQKSGTHPQRLDEIPLEDTPRLVTSNDEFNRALGGGIVPGSLVLLGGEPGIGKSTLLLQIAQCLEDAGRRVLYVSGEESAYQIKMRAERVCGSASNADAGSQGTMPRLNGERNGEIFILPESCLERILEALENLRPTDLIIDSVQTTFSEALESAAGSIGQVRHVASQLLGIAKSRQIPTFLIGHVTKDGGLAGPKALEHIVDTVLYFEGERHHNHRIVRAVKNRFGAANEIGIFEMTARGLVPVPSASRLFLNEREISSPGSSVVCAIEGTRPILVEVQSLVAASQYGSARRLAAGVDPNRVAMLVAILEKRLGMPMTNCDVYVNTSGGLEVDEPGADLAVLSAIFSCIRNRPLARQTVFLGELSLAGEVRPISQIHARLKEAAAMGFDRCLLPAGNLPLVDAVRNLELIPIKTVTELSDLAF